jgi:hypothetical protein
LSLENRELSSPPDDSIEIRDTARFRKLSKLKRANVAIWRHLCAATSPYWHQGAVQELVAKLRRCGAQLLLRQHLSSSRLQVRSGNFCQLRALCPCCDAARARRVILRFLAHLDRAEADGGQHYLVTLTWPPPAADVQEGDARSAPRRTAAEEVAALHVNLAVGLRGLSLLWERRRRKQQGPFRAVLGLIASVEVTRTRGDWHPHLHCIVTLPKGQRVCVKELRQEWEKLTGGRQLRIDPLTGRKGLLEAFKYALKPQEIGPGGKVDLRALWWRFLGFQALRGKRLLRTFGLYFGLDAEPDLIGPEPGPELHDYLDFISNWCDRTGKYNVEELSRWLDANSRVLAATAAAA